MNKYRKIISVLVLLTFLVAQNLSFAAVAMAAPDRPNTPDSTEQTDQPDTTDETETPDQPDNAPSDEEEESEPEVTPTPSPTPSPSPSPEPQKEEEENDYHNVQEAPEAPEVETANDTGGDNDDANMGDTSIETGDAEASGAINNLGNTNIAGVEEGDEGQGGISIVNEENGSGSDNSGVVVIEDDSITTQDNNADLDNSLEVDSNSGENSSSKNTGGDTSIKTGDANTSGTILNSVNTNMAGAVVSEFNVVDDHNGDLVLDYEAGCVSGCDAIGGLNLENKSNGSDSTNETEVEVISDDLTFQNNDADVENELVLTANTGENTADKNTGGDTSIKTGDANVSGSVLNFLNNNIAGNVVYGVVNVFGDLVGDIIVPEKYASTYNSTTAVGLENTGNGSGSENNGEVLLAESDEYVQFNNADILNNLEIDASTGENSASKNTNGDNEVETGDVNVDAQILNVANNNIVGGDWWIVLINEAGNWIGQIFTPQGAMNGGNFALGSGAEAQVNDKGDITVANNGNGADSENSGSVEVTDNSYTEQNNNAEITNNIKLSANTGKNSASKNTGGKSDISTGDANVQFNLVNFVNNNFAGGNVFLTVVNVFGNWFGDFMTPGQVKAEEDNDDPQENSNDKGIGGNNDPSNNNSSSDNSSSSSDNSESDANNNDDEGEVLASSNITYSSQLPATGLTNKLASGVQDEQLALADTSNRVATSNEEKTSINLAWGLLLIPAYFALRIVRRRFLGA